MSSFESVRDLLFCFAEVDRLTADEETLRKINRFSLGIFSAGIHTEKHDFRPDELEADLEAVRKQIKGLAKAISQIDPWAARVARREAERTRLLAAGLPEDLVSIEMIWRDPPVTEWIDRKAISALTELGDALERPIEDLIHKGRSLPIGKGRKPDLVARKVAYYAGWALHAISDKKPVYWKDSSSFAKFCEALFREFSLPADTRRACEWALSELAKEGKL